MKKIMLVILLIIALVAIVGCSEEDKDPLPINPPLTPSCVDIGGEWHPEYNECLNVGKSNCESIGGTFDECASACRNDPEAEACIMMCVPVCTIN